MMGISKRLCALLAFDLSLVCNSFILSNPDRNMLVRHICQNQNDEQDAQTDLFEYFDPLLSPHAYPNGISAENKPVEMQVKETFERDSEPALAEESTGEEQKPTAVGGSDKEADLFSYFDPLLSPHEYPNGISTDSKPAQLRDVKEEAPMNVAKGGPRGEGKSERKVGVLLMDHGSRNPDSNARLKRLAELYQLTIDDGENIIVAYAHMEITSPSIPEGLGKLIRAGVDEIVCHPYFLSPGRHVREDIPQIIEEAIASLEIDIPVITTEPVGSNTQLMLGAIHSLVRANSEVLQQKNRA